MKVNSQCFSFVVLNIVFELHGLEVRPSVKENHILKTANAIRNTTNALFLAFKLKGIKHNPRLRQYSLIHNFFSTLTLKDHDTLNQIAIESRFDVNNINNESRNFMDALNDLLNEDSKKAIEQSNKDNLQGHVNDFLTNLEYLKDKNGVNDNIFNINNQILNILKNEDRSNLTQDRQSHENDSFLSDNEFWVPEQSGRRIYKGDKTKIKYFPFMASIQIFNSFQCGGCIVKSDLIITAASCLQLAWNNRFFRENPAFLSVRVGSNFYRGGGESIAVLEVYFHPEYNPKTLKNNICLLRLMRKIKFRKRSRRVKKIDFDRNPSNLPMTTDGITIVGWGAKGINNIIQNPWSNQLSFSVLDIYPIRECQDIYSRQYVTQKNFCAGFFSKGGGACNGDVGGPGIVGGILAGIVSFGSPRCGTPDAPTVFTKLGYYTDWIESIMEQDVPNIAQRTTLRTTRPPITMPRYDTKKTTFVLEPLDGNWKPSRINTVTGDALRMLDDEVLFKEFLATMFGSQEAREYEELFVKTATKEAKHVIRQKIPELEKNKDKVELLTKNFEETTPIYTYTVLNDEMLGSVRESNEELSDNDDDNDEIERNILKLIENIDVSKQEDKQEDQIESLDSSESGTEELILQDDDTIVSRDDSFKNIDDSVLTLLYLSDSEKNAENIKSIGNVIDDFDEHVNAGMSISMDGFKDLTFRDNGTGYFYNLPKDEMYELLAEAIDDVVKSKENKIL